MSREGRLIIDPHALLERLGIRKASATAFYMEGDCLGIRIRAPWLPDVPEDQPLPVYSIHVELRCPRVVLDDGNGNEIEVPL